MDNSTVTVEYRVDQYDNVYDKCGLFYCKWFTLTPTEKKIVKQNPMSAR